jgi:hypothetical protein
MDACLRFTLLVYFYTLRKSNRDAIILYKFIFWVKEKKLKKIVLLFVLGIIVAGCGVKSDLQHPGGDAFPRNYPTE